MFLTILLTIDTKEKRSKFEAIYNEYNQIMMNIAFAITKNEYDAEEVLNTALFAIAENIDKVQTDNPVMLKSYIYKIVKNAAINLLREKKKISEILSLDYCLYLIEAEETYHSIDNDEQYIRIVNRIKALPDKYRDVLVLRLLHNFTIDEIASALNRKIGTVKSQIDRGSKMLRVILEEEGIK